MSTKILTIAAVALSLTAGAASAAQFGERTQAGVGLFDQGGELYNGNNAGASTTHDYGYQSGSLDRISTQSTRTNADAVISNPAVPADNPHNERSQGVDRSL